ncbi:MAG: YdcF family protein [Peptococcaceae bacterium]|nr:YdcF family protein [Peptococcaceae bacterium]
MTQSKPPIRRQPAPRHRRRRRRIPFLLKLIIVLLLLPPLMAVAINLIMFVTTTGNMQTTDELAGADADCIVVLGAGIEADGSPSPILAERLDTAIALYENGASKDIIVSGGEDAAQSEVSAMRNYLLQNGIPSLAITTDTHGIDTYASITNLRTHFDVQSAIIVSQRFHLYRAIYIAEQMKLDASGCPTSKDGISDTALLTREFFARLKDFAQCTIADLPAPLAAPAEALYNQIAPSTNVG